MAESGDQGKVKVIDRRWFTADGDLREPAGPPSAVAKAEPAPAPAVEPAAAPPSPQPVRVADAQPPVHEADAQPPTAAPPADVATEGGAAAALPAGPGIADIVDLLAQQAMAFLSGQVPGRGRDPATARYFIDLLGVLKEKTAGRLTLEETNFLDDVLYQLRSLFVGATR